MEVRIKQGEELVDATIEMVDGVMVVSPISKFEPKDGDVVNTDGNISIFKEARGSVDISFNSYALLSEGNLYLNMIVFYSNCRPATEEEKQKLFDKLAEEGYSWDADKKELIKLKWKPIYEEYYFTILFRNTTFGSVRQMWFNDWQDKINYDKGWCFKTEAECQAFCYKLNETINQVKP